MNTLMYAASSALEEMEVEFPNLFGGTAISYRRGFSLFGITIYWYGVLIAIGVVLAYIYVMHRCTKEFGLVKDRVFDVAFICIIGGFLCARIYYCVFVTLDPNNPTNYNFITTFTKIRDGGIAIYGGIIGAVLIGIFVCKWRKVNFFAMADMAAFGFLIGQTLGRWGNFINQEAYGAACPDNWLFAMGGNVIRTDPQIPAGSFVHPCFLYESVWCLLAFVFLHIYSKKLRSFDGEIALLYVAWYGFGRFFIEQLRTDSLYAGPLKISQWVGAVTFVAAIICFIIAKIKTKKSGKLLYVNTKASRALIKSDLKAEKERLMKKKAKKAKKEKKAESILGDDAEDDYADDIDLDDEEDDDENDDDNEDDEDDEDDGDDSEDSGDEEDEDKDDSDDEEDEDDKDDKDEDDEDNSDDDSADFKVKK